MISRRSSTDQPGLSGTDYVLEGASVRDRFLTAFILQHKGPFQIPWPQTERPDPSEMDGALLLEADEEESFSIQLESAYEPLTIQVIGDWLDTDDDNDM